MSSPMPGFTHWRTRASSVSTAPGDNRRRHDSTEFGSSPPPSSVIGIDHPSRLSSSFSGQREPIRSFIHGSGREHLAPKDSTHTARTVREDTADLATYVLTDGKDEGSRSFLQRSRPSVSDVFSSEPVESEAGEDRNQDVILEVSEPPSPNDGEQEPEDEGPSALANLLRKSPPQSIAPDRSRPRKGVGHERSLDEPEDLRSRRSTRGEDAADDEEHTENTPLLSGATSRSRTPDEDVEDMRPEPRKSWMGGLKSRAQGAGRHAARTFAVAANPKQWDGKAIWQTCCVAPASCLPAVCVGLLLNILDALSYGMILFPLGKPIFSHLGPAGISIFYVSTIISQLTFSTGSIFKGSVGSELIEVVPFFHNMAQKITDIVGVENPDAVIATTIVSYSMSSMITGLVFYLMGKFKFGFMVGFIPRHILIGCIGGVGWFLIATGFEVSARLEGSLEYDLDTLHKLTRPETLPQWIVPLVLAIVLFWGQARVKSKYFLPLFILAIPLIFYIFVLSLNALEIDNLRDKGWIFEGPPAGEPWWYFYTLFKFTLVRWDAVAECIPAMFALTFFGILHVPINVPALALQCGEDNADLDKELRLHGYSNFVSGCFGSIQNYLVYANTLFFMRSGGDSRLGGYMLAALTFGVMTVGPSLVGFIPVMMVGCLIFDLGFELLLEAVWLPRKKLKLAEFLTVIAIVLVMGIYDFVIGIGVGIVLAFVSLIVQTSRVSAVRSTFAGDTVTSTVRRNPSQHHYLQRVGGQIFVMRLTGYLFFGTIVSVENKIRSLLDHKTFSEKPIKFLVLDLWHVTGLDYSAGEGFNTISRLLGKKDVVLVLSGVEDDSQLGRNLRAVGLGANGTEVVMLPDLNSALESCENELLKTLYARQAEMNSTKRVATASLDVPKQTESSFSSFDPPFNSPRQTHLAEAASDAIRSDEVQQPQKWQSFKEPLRLMLQIFQGLSDKNEDFWFQLTHYFKRRELAAGTVLFRRGEEANGFYLVERGILRAEYDLPQGWLCESIMPGTTCGELPFFSETNRTATAQVERECVVWQMDREGWKRLQQEEPEVARELLRVSLKLTSERMSSITSYILTLAG
ncbi:sulfate transporter family-domain-containing protein [Emericellopsis atlantica]|uniref:Sulfate transporter family-domain-containing protein n=1 Tax=Emericellopsis atlantica TaxID=2614577 RepID=A0A9P7ZDM8_9HYPO|nr:sulfate transporter family-domain-containing protein [Emericellopsis atlantica]KAG9249862.1 sulfate transporter family-domain-containing protein [Emericellopsis atlantica]